MPQTNNGFIIIATFFVAFVLTLLPLPDWTVWLRPAWVLMVLIYWIMTVPYRVNVGTAWLAGLCLDILNGTLLGEHALAMTLVAYVVARSYSRFSMYHVLQQGFNVLLLVLFYQFIIFCIQGFLGKPPLTWLYWSSSVTSMLLWPWVCGIMRNFRHRFKAV